MAIKLQVLLTATLCASVIASAQDLSLTYSQVWPDVVLSNGRLPLKVEIKNSGQNTVGILTTRSSFGSMAYPVELPKGAHKVLTVYVQGNQWTENRLELKTPSGIEAIEVELKGQARQNTDVIGVIGSTPGLLASLRTGQRKGRSAWDTTCQPEDAPDRSVGYAGCKLIVLTDGSERISDFSVLALQRYVLAGGVLLFTGGPSAPWLRDPRWQGFVPVETRSATSVTEVGKLAALGGAPLQGPVSVSGSRPALGGKAIVTANGTPLIVERSTGLGKVVVWTFDPFSEPLRTWQGRDNLFRALVGADTKSAQFLGVSQRDQTDMFSRGRRTYPDANSPFQTETPPAGQIALILFGFLLTVVPLNFLVLNKVNRRELAWLTVPVISIGFSAMVFATAGKLYSAEMARLTDGYLVTHDGTGQAVYVGQQDLFIPRGGTYDLGFQGVESAENSEQVYSMFGGPADFTKEPELLDIGQVVAPRFEASNFTFRSLEIVQAVAFPQRLVFRPKFARTAQGLILSGTMRNDTPWTLVNPIIVYQGAAIKLEDLSPGESQVVRATLVTGDLSALEGATPPPVGDAIALLAKVPGAPIGTSLGTESVEQTRCRLLYTWSVP